MTTTPTEGDLFRLTIKSDHRAVAGISELVDTWSACRTAAWRFLSTLVGALRFEEDDHRAAQRVESKQIELERFDLRFPNSDDGEAWLWTDRWSIRIERAATLHAVAS